MSGYIGNIPVPQSTQTRDNFTATSGQTTFSTSGYTPSYLDVYLNGVHLDPSDYTATNGTDVVLGTGATAGDVLEVVAFSTFTTTSDIDNNSTTTGTLTVDGGDVSFYEDTGTTAKFFWDASAENLGLGTTTPGLTTFGSSAVGIQIATGAVPTLGLKTTTGEESFVAQSSVNMYLYNAANGPMRFSTNATEAMRIDSSGNLLVGTTSTSSIVAGTVIYGGSNKGVITHTYAGRPLYINRLSTNGDIIELAKDGTTVGSISVTGSSTSYNTSSDYRLKTDVQPMTGATERLKALKPVNFEWISSGERVDGFLAHEAQEVVPEAVTGTKDAMRTEEYEVTPAVLDDDGNVVTEAVMGEREVPDYQGIDQSKLVPLLVAAMQEQQTVIEDLKARIEVLEGASA